MSNTGFSLQECGPAEQRSANEIPGHGLGYCLPIQTAITLTLREQEYPPLWGVLPAFHCGPWVINTVVRGEWGCAECQKLISPIISQVGKPRRRQAQRLEQGHRASCRESHMWLNPRTPYFQPPHFSNTHTKHLDIFLKCRFSRSGEAWHSAFLRRFQVLPMPLVTDHTEQQQGSTPGRLPGSRDPSVLLLMISRLKFSTSTQQIL